jgi:hypothetical protein
MKPRSNLRLPRPETVMVPGRRGPLAKARCSATRDVRCCVTQAVWAVCFVALFKLSAPLCPAEETTPLPPPAAVSPEELLRSLSRCGKPDWASKFRAPSAVALNSRAQIALVLGGVFADGYLAAQAEDAQQCRNIGKDLLRLSKTLGVQTELLDRSRSIADSAQNKDWGSLRRELQATEAELGAALRKHEDEALARLVSLGAWMRSTEIIASLLSEHYSENAASLLRQPALGLLLGRGLDKLGDKLEADPAIDLIRPKLHTVERLLNASADTPPSHGEVKEIATVLTSILRDVNEKRH